MLGQRRRLEGDLERWRERGWVTAEGAEAIRAEIAAARKSINLAAALGVLGAVLIGFAAMSFVAANWQEMPRILRLGLLLAALWLSYAASGHLADRGHPRFSDAAVLLGCGIFGASIMLISQMYHMDGNPPDAVLVWAVGTLLAGVALGSNAALAMAMLLTGLWGAWQTADRLAVFWPFLLLWGAVTVPILWRDWRPGIHLSTIALSVFTVSLGYLLLVKGHAHGIVVLIGSVVAASGAFGGRAVPAIAREQHMAVGYGGAIAFAGLFALQFLEFRRPDVGALVLYAGLALALTLAVVAWAFRTGNRGVLWLAYAGFSLEILALYFKTIGTLLGSSVFFLTAGLVFMGLAWLAWRLHAHESHTKMERA